jgi:hypothetical protein
MDDETYAPFVLVDEARAWVMECVGNPEDVEDAPDAEVMEWVRKHYDGGYYAFVADTYAGYGFDVLAATLRDGIAAR